MPITGMELEGVATEGTVRPELLVKKRNGDVVSFDANRIQERQQIAEHGQLDVLCPLGQRAANHIAIGHE